jgi:DNA-binding response OmpR family regulator
MAKSPVLLVIEARHAEIPSFAADLQKKGFDVQTVQNGATAVSKLREVNPSLVVVNAASLRSTGLRICQSLREKNARIPVVLILARGNSIEKEDAADAVLSLPFTVQKLVNRIKPLLPGDGKNVLNAGPVRLDVEHRRVRSLGKSTKLTPRLVTLLQMLMEHHGEVVERETLFCSRKCGRLTTPATRAPWTCTSPGCGGPSNSTPRNRSSSRPSAAWATG